MRAPRRFSTERANTARSLTSQYVGRAASAAGAARLLFVHDKVTRSVNVNLTRPVDNSLPGLIVTYGGARRTRRERLARESL